MGDGSAEAGEGATPGLGCGAMIMKSVSLFLASGRRVSGSRKRTEQQTDPAKRRRPRAQGMAGRQGRNNKLTPKALEGLKRKTHFTKVELEALFQIYRKLIASAQPVKRTTATGKPAPVNVEGIDRTMFREILYSTFDLVTEEALSERLWAAWDGAGGSPGGGGGTGGGTGGSGGGGSPSAVLRFEGWLTGLSVFLRGTPAERISLCFRVYDLNNDGFITKDEMFQLLRNSLVKQPGDEDPDEGARELAELALRKLDIDQDGKVSLEDYKSAIAKEPLLLEAFGQILPTPADCQTFLETLQPVK